MYLCIGLCVGIVLVLVGTALSAIGARHVIQEYHDNANRRRKETEEAKSRLSRMGL